MPAAAVALGTVGTEWYQPRMEIRGVQIETLHDAERYTQAQLERAWAIATLLKRGRLILIEEPEG